MSQQDALSKALAILAKADTLTDTGMDRETALRSVREDALRTLREVAA
jgi:hypothetical protein